MRSQELSSVDTADVVGDVSFVHSCGNGCKFLEDAGVRQVEREQAVVAGRLLFQHDFNNKVFYLIVFVLTLTVLYWKFSIENVNCKV